MLGGESRSKREDKLKLGIALLKVIAPKEKLRGLHHFGQVVANFLGAAAGEQGDPGCCGVQGILRCELRARDGGRRQLGQRVPDKLCGDATIAVELLFEREDDEHLVDVFPDEADAVFLPGPELRADEKDHGNAEAVELLGELEVNIREVDEDGNIGPALANGALEAAEFAVDAGQMADHLGDAHDCHIFRSNHDLQTHASHALAAHAEESGGLPRGGKTPLERFDEKGSVMLATGFACRDEDVGTRHAALPLAALATS